MKDDIEGMVKGRRKREKKRPVVKTTLRSKKLWSKRMTEDRQNWTNGH